MSTSNELNGIIASEYYNLHGSRNDNNEIHDEPYPILSLFISLSRYKELCDTLDKTIKFAISNLFDNNNINLTKENILLKRFIFKNINKLLSDFLDAGFDVDSKIDSEEIKITLQTNQFFMEKYFIDGKIKMPGNIPDLKTNISSYFNKYNELKNGVKYFDIDIVDYICNILINLLTKISPFLEVYNKNIIDLYDIIENIIRSKPIEFK